MKNIKKYENFNEINETNLDIMPNIDTDSDENITITLELKIQPDTVKKVQSIIDEIGSDENVEDVLHEYFLYNSGYYHDNTYGEEMEDWIKKNISS